MIEVFFIWIGFVFALRLLEDLLRAQEDLSAGSR